MLIAPDNNLDGLQDHHRACSAWTELHYHRDYSKTVMAIDFKSLLTVFLDMHHYRNLYNGSYNSITHSCNASLI